MLRFFTEHIERISFGGTCLYVSMETEREPLSESVEEHRGKKQRKYQEKNSTPHTVHTSLFCLGPACRSRKVLLFKASKKRVCIDRVFIY